MVLGCLHSAPLREHTRCLWGHKRLPLCPLTAPTREDRIFVDLQRAVPKMLAREARNSAWILAATRRLVNERVSARQDIAKDQAIFQRLGCAIKSSLQEDRKQRAEEGVVEMETLMGLDSPLHREAWHRIERWYKAACSGYP